MSQSVARALDDSSQRTTLRDLQREAINLALPALVLAGTGLVLSTEAFHWPIEVSLLGTSLIMLSLIAWALLERSYLAAAWLLVDDVLNLSQIEAGRMTLIQEWNSLVEIIDAATIAVGSLFASKGLSLETDVPPELPRLFCDGTRIRQVVLNLLSNAGRFTEHGGVRIRARREDDNIVVSVTDSGPGITSEDQQKIFEPFQQLDTSLRVSSSWARMVHTTMGMWPVTGCCCSLPSTSQPSSLGIITSSTMIWGRSWSARLMACSGSRAPKTW
jgi:hypothetical protein